MDELAQARCLHVHERLTSHALAWPFLEPVDPVAMNLPTYFDIVRSPMDLSTMRQKLLTHSYDTPDAYRRDFILMCENAMEFNRDDTHEDSVALMAQKLLAFGLRALDEAFSETATTDWNQVVYAQLQEQLMARAKQACMRTRWKKDSFVARFNREKLEKRAARMAGEVA